MSFGFLIHFLPITLGMRVATFSNARCTIQAVLPDEAGWTGSFNIAFRAGSVMGFSLCGIALFVLFLLINVFSIFYPCEWSDEGVPPVKILMETIAGYGLGGSCMALFGRVGGGIYTKAADVGADLAGKVVSGIPEDDPRNPATIADNVGDNVGDVAGMGSDLFGSFAEASCAALVISTQSKDLITSGFSTILFPLSVSACGIIVCAMCSFLATDVSPVKKESDVEKVILLLLDHIMFCHVLLHLLPLSSSHALLHPCMHPYFSYPYFGPLTSLFSTSGAQGPAPLHCRWDVYLLLGPCPSLPTLHLHL